MVKRVLKSIFPAAFLKHAFFLYNSTKVKTVDRFVFPEYLVNKNDFLLYRQGFPFQDNCVKTESITNMHVRQYMDEWTNWTQEEYIYTHHGEVTIEPTIGWAIVGWNKLLYYSLGISRTLFLPKPGIFKWFVIKKKVKMVHQLISLRDTGEENYFHFYNDVLAKLYFLQLKGIDINKYSLLISENTWNKGFFQFWYENVGRNKNYNWVIQKHDEYIKCCNTIFCKPLTHHIPTLNKLFKPYFEISIVETEKCEKIYLKRNPKRLRFIENSNEVESVVKKYDYKIIDTDELSPSQQIGLFRGLKKIIGIHGAGLTNLFFSEQCEQLIELFPPPDSGYLPFHYIMAASYKGIQYEAIIGKPSMNKFGGSFIVDPTALEKLIQTKD